MGNGFCAHGQRNFEWFNWDVCSVEFTHGCDPITALRFCLRNAVGMNYRLVWCGKLQLGYVMWTFYERRRCDVTIAVGATHGIDATPSNRTAGRCPAYLISLTRANIILYMRLEEEYLGRLYRKNTASVSFLIRVIPLKSDPFSKVFRGITLKTFFELPILGYN